jgi:hypothetical protein
MEIALIQYATDVSSEAHIEVQKVLYVDFSSPSLVLFAKTSLIL